MARDAGNPKKGLFESKEKYTKRRNAEVGSYLDRANVPPSNDIDTKGRPVDPNRTKWGYRGHDASREPMKEAVATKRHNAGLPSAQQVRDTNKVNPDQVKARAAASKSTKLAKK